MATLSAGVGVAGCQREVSAFVKEVCGWLAGLLQYIAGEHSLSE